MGHQLSFWGHYTKWNRPERERQILNDPIYMWNLKGSKLIETESRMVVARGWEGGENEEMLAKRHKLLTRWITSGHLIYRIKIMVNNNVSHPSGLPRCLSSKESPCQCSRHGFHLWAREIPWRRKWQPTAVFYLESLVDRGAWWATVHGSQRVRHDLETKHILKCSPDIDGFNGEFFQIFKKD